MLYCAYPSAGIVSSGEGIVALLRHMKWEGAMDFGMFMEFGNRQGSSQAAAFHEGFEQSVAYR